MKKLSKKEIGDQIATFAEAREAARKYYTCMMPDGIASSHYLSNTCKIVFMTIFTMYSEGHKFFKSNKVMAKEFHTTSRSISRIISTLINKGLIRPYYKKNNTRILFVTKRAFSLFGKVKKDYKKDDTSTMDKLLRDNKKLRAELKKYKGKTNSTSSHRTKKSTTKHKKHTVKHTKKTMAKKAKAKDEYKLLSNFTVKYIINETDTQFNNIISSFNPTQTSIAKTMKAIFDISNSKIKTANTGLTLTELEHKNKLDIKKLDLARMVLLQRARLYKLAPRSRYSHQVRDARKSLNQYYWKNAKSLDKTHRFYSYKLRGLAKNFNRTQNQSQSQSTSHYEQDKDDIKAEENMAKQVKRLKIAQAKKVGAK